MKKVLNILMVMAAVLLFAGCQKSQIEAQTEAQTDENGIEFGVIAPTEHVEYKEPSTEVVNPEGAKGPGDAVIKGDAYEFYPEDKKPQATEEAYVDVRYYYVTKAGIREDFEALPGTTCTAEGLIGILVSDGVLAEGTEMISCESDGTAATVTLSGLEGQFPGATKEQLAQCVANTLIDNLFLDNVTVVAGDEVMGPLELRMR